MNFTLKLCEEEELKAAIEKGTAKYEKLWDKRAKATKAFERAYVRMMNKEDNMADICHQ